MLLAIEVQQSPHGSRPIVDERFYVEWARAIARGDLMGDGPFWLDPLPAYVLGLIFALTKGSLFAARLCFALVGVGTVAVTGALARTLWGRKEGIAAMWLLALYGPHTFMSGFLLKEALTVHATAWALLLGVRAMTSDSAKLWGALGLTGGALGLLRGNYVPLLFFLLAWGFIVARRRFPLLLAGVVLPLVLASAHNLAMGGSWRPITPLGGHNFFLGNNPNASGGFDPVEWVKPTTKREHSDWLAEAERRTGRTLTQQEASDYWFKEGLAFWRDQPGSALALTAKKAWLLVHDYEIPDMYPYTCFRAYFTPVLWALPLGFGALLGLALVGMWTSRSDRCAWFPIAFALLYGGAVVVFFVFDRYRIPLCVVLCAFAARAIVLGLERKLKAAHLATVAAATVAAFIPSPQSRARAASDAFCVRQVGELLSSEGRSDEAQRWLDEANRLSPPDRE